MHMFYDYRLFCCECRFVNFVTVTHQFIFLTCMRSGTPLSFSVLNENDDDDDDDDDDDVVVDNDDV